jgi:16S rRNA (cytosine1402-N4)-methyltransferase
VVGIDRDPEAIRRSRSRLSRWGERVVLKEGSFSDLVEMTADLGTGKFAGALFDLGTSRAQIEEARRGFSFSRDGPLDMRMDPSLGVTAADLINGLTRHELITLFKKLGEERRARRLADAVVRRRRLKPIRRTRELAALIEETVGRRRQGAIHPATRVFQALRIAVNSELEELAAALPQAAEALEEGGRLVVISFHSLEDRMVKNFFKNSQVLTVLTKKPVRPGAEEIEMNPRSRSAKLRAAERVELSSGGRVDPGRANLFPSGKGTGGG